MALTAHPGIGAAMAEPHFTTRRIDSPCLFSSNSGAHTAAPEFRFWQLGGGCRVFFVINTADSPSWIAPHFATSGAIVTIESPHAPEFRVTSHSLLAKLILAAKCP